MTENKWDKLSEKLFFVAIFIEIVIVIIDKSALINPIEGRLFQLTFILCAARIAMSKYNLKEWLIIVAFIGLGFVADRINNRNEVIRFVAFIAASKGINGRKLQKMVFYTTLVGMIGLVILSVTGVMGNMYVVADYGRGQVEKRFCLGLGHPNALHCMFWAILSLGVYLFLERIKLWNYCVLMILNILLFTLTDSRTGLVMSTFVVLCGVVYHLYPAIKENKLIYILGIVALLVCVAFSIDAATYDGYLDAEARPIMHWIDNKMTGRVFEGGVTGAIEKWSLFSDSGIKGYTDMGYIKLFHWYGIIPASVYLTSIILLIVYFYKKRNAAALILTTSFIFYSLVEAHAISPYFGRNYLLMLFIGCWSEVFFVDNGHTGYFWQIKHIVVKKNRSPKGC